MDTTLNELAQSWQFLRAGRHTEAEKLAASLLKRFPDNVSALAVHAAALWSGGGSIETALAELGRAVVLAPGNGAVRHNLATLLASNGDLEASNREFRQALSLKPDDTAAFFGLVMNLRYAERDPLLADMEALYRQNRVAGIDHELLGFALAKVYDDLGEPARAMEMAMAANALVARGYDLASERNNLAELQKMAASDAFRRLTKAKPSARPPLFIVGMNRSGTTLVESILSRHPAVLAQGEIADMHQLEMRLLRQAKSAGRSVGRNSMLGLVKPGWFDARAAELTSLTAGRANGPFSLPIDKLPDNALRLGLISLVYPDARVVHVRRHPLDVGLSNFMRRFTAGQGFSFRMDWIGAKTRLVADSMALWKQALDLPILDVSYERLVADPEAESRRLIAFAGLEWDDACLTPSRTQRSVLTASQWQVRQPVYTSSVGRWKRYEPWLGPMIAAMGGMGWIEKEVADQASRATLSVTSA